MAKKAKKRKYSKGAAKKVKRAMKKRKAGTLKSGRETRQFHERSLRLGRFWSSAGREAARRGNRRHHRAQRIASLPGAAGASIEFPRSVKRPVGQGKCRQMALRKTLRQGDRLDRRATSRRFRVLPEPVLNFLAARYEPEWRRLKSLVACFDLENQITGRAFLLVWPKRKSALTVFKCM